MQATSEAPARYITFMANAGDGLSKALYTNAPAADIAMEESVDYAESKALSGDYLIATFGHKLMTLRIRGLDIYSKLCSVGDNTSGMTIQQFYDKFNVHTNPQARVDVSSSGQNSGAFRCIIVSLNRSSSHTTAVAGIGDYSLVMLGVKL